MITSKELSEKIKKAGFEGESELMPYNEYENGELIGVYKKYDILNDLCVRYKRKVFGNGSYFTCEAIFNMIYAGKKSQKEIEDYIVANSILFK